VLKLTHILDGDSPSVTLSHKLFSDKGSFIDLLGLGEESSTLMRKLGRRIYYSPAV